MDLQFFILMFMLLTSKHFAKTEVCVVYHVGIYQEQS